jgi:cell division protein FtsW
MTKSKEVKEPKRPGQKSHQGQLDITFLVLTLFLLTIGLVMLFSSVMRWRFFYEGTASTNCAQVGVCFVWHCCHVRFSCIDYHIWQKFAYLILGIAVVLLLVVVAMKLASSTHKPVRWIYIGPIQFQPSEIAKFAVVVAFGRYISKYYDRMKTFQYGVLPFVGVLADCGRV